MKSLVVFYSRTGNAKFVAETVAAELGSDLEEIIDMKNREGKLGYLSGGSDAARGKETKIAETKRSPADYDLIIVGTPVWAGRITPAIRTYLGKNDLSGKKVAVFFTQGGSKPQSIEKIKTLMPNSSIIGELSLTSPLGNKEESEKQISTWCTKLKI
jgi:flavodoxin